MIQEYPKYVFHGTLPMRRVENKTQHESLGEGWAETPDAFKEGAPTVEVAAPADPPQVLRVEIPIHVTKRRIK